MQTNSELLILQAIVEFANSNGLNKSKVARDTDVSRSRVHEVINKYRELEINVKK